MFKHLNKDGLIYFWGKVKSYVSNQLLNYYTKTQTNTELGKKANSVHSHSNATTTTSGYMSYPDKTKLDGIAAGANKYVHPNFTARGTNLYKVSVDSQGHVNAVSLATKQDILNLGIISPKEFEVTFLSTGWVADGSLFTQRVDVTGMLEVYKPFPWLMTGTTTAEKEKEFENMQIKEIETFDGYVIATSTAKPTIDLNIGLYVLY